MKIGTEHFESIAQDRFAMVLPKDLAAQLELGKSPLLVDVRKYADYSRSHIPGSVHCEWKDLGGLVDSGRLNKDEPVVIVCYVGQSSSLATGILRSMGYKAYSLFTGFSGWVAESLPEESDNSSLAFSS